MNEDLGKMKSLESPTILGRLGISRPAGFKGLDGRSLFAPAVYINNGDDVFYARQVGWKRALMGEIIDTATARFYLSSFLVAEMSCHKDRSGM